MPPPHAFTHIYASRNEAVNFFFLSFFSFFSVYFLFHLLMHIHRRPLGRGYKARISIYVNTILCRLLRVGARRLRRNARVCARSRLRFKRGLQSRFSSVRPARETTWRPRGKISSSANFQVNST